MTNAACEQRPLIVGPISLSRLSDADRNSLKVQLATLDDNNVPSIRFAAALKEQVEAVNVQEEMLRLSSED